MKKALLLVLVPLLSVAQIPANYYLSAENNSDDDLKFELNQTIDNHTKFPYTSSNTDVWDILKETDKDPNNPSNVILIYSGISVDGPQEYNNSDGWTREHVWAKSRGDFGTTMGPGTDVHALRPLDNTTNSIRSNRGFDNCTDCSIVYDKWDNDTGSLRDNNAWSFEPRDEVKGDVARMIFYMDVRYEGYDSYPDLEVSETILGIEDNSPFHGILLTLLDWHREDPVDPWEENRNNIIYYNYQNNRNPFIDYPELVEHIWGNMTGIIWTSGTLGVSDFNETAIELYPNPVSEFLNIAGINNETLLEIYDSLGQILVTKTITGSQNKIDVSQFSSGIYLLKFTQNKVAFVKRLVII
ncbi:MAG: endonuclease I [bacterium]|jgi:endonuclease I